MKTLRHVIVIVNLLKDDAPGLQEEILSFLESRNIVCTVYKYGGEPIVPEKKEADLAISLGGDGTVLFAARHFAPLGIPIMAVNLGEFGFITEITQSEWRETFLKFEVGVRSITERLMLDVQVFREGELLENFLGLNDTVVTAEGISKLVNLRVELNGTYLGHYRADGIIVATPTGSTAYSAAAGGPILAPELEAMIINPICPFTLSNRPIVVPGEDRIAVSVENRQRTKIILTVDGQKLLPLRPGDEIVYRKAACKASIIRSEQRNFYEVVRKKLKWSGGVDD